MFLWVLLLCHTCAFQAACGDEPGVEGGPCKQGACGGTCDSGLVCDGTGTCVPGGTGCDESSPSATLQSTPQDNQCTNASVDQCSAGQVAYECSGWAVPTDPFGNPTVCVQIGGGANEARYCCDFSYGAPPIDFPTPTPWDGDAAEADDRVEDAPRDTTAADEVEASLVDAPAAE